MKKDACICFMVMGIKLDEAEKQVAHCSTCCAEVDHTLIGYYSQAHCLDTTTWRREGGITTLGKI